MFHLVICHKEKLYKFLFHADFNNLKHNLCYSSYAHVTRFQLEEYTRYNYIWFQIITVYSEALMIKMDGANFGGV